MTSWSYWSVSLATGVTRRECCWSPAPGDTHAELFSDMGSTPIASTKSEKSEPFSCRRRVRIFCFTLKFEQKYLFSFPQAIIGGEYGFDHFARLIVQVLTQFCFYRFQWTWQWYSWTDSRYHQCYQCSLSTEVHRFFDRHSFDLWFFLAMTLIFC